MTNAILHHFPAKVNQAYHLFDVNELGTAWLGYGTYVSIETAYMISCRSRVHSVAYEGIG